VKPFVLDCSVSASWCLKDASNDAAEEILLKLSRVEALTPPLWPFEMANVLTVAERRGRISPADASRAVEVLLSLPIRVEPGGIGDMERSRSLAREHGLSAYDACYLDLAQRYGIALATLDAALVRAARKSGVSVLP
jgi:predicted nucleic acid-binding protein